MRIFSGLWPFAEDLKPTAAGDKALQWARPGAEVEGMVLGREGSLDLLAINDSILRARSEMPLPQGARVRLQVVTPGSPVQIRLLAVLPSPSHKPQGLVRDFLTLEAGLRRLGPLMSPLLEGQGSPAVQTTSSPALGQALHLIKALAQDGSALPERIQGLSALLHPSTEGDAPTVIGLLRRAMDVLADRPQAELPAGSGRPGQGLSNSVGPPIPFSEASSVDQASTPMHTSPSNVKAASSEMAGEALRAFSTSEGPTASQRTSESKGFLELGRSPDVQEGGELGKVPSSRSSGALTQKSAFNNSSGPNASIATPDSVREGVKPEGAARSSASARPGTGHGETGQPVTRTADTAWSTTSSSKSGDTLGETAAARRVGVGVLWTSGPHLSSEPQTPPCPSQLPLASEGEKITPHGLEIRKENADGLGLVRSDTPSMSRRFSSGAPSSTVSHHRGEGSSPPALPRTRLPSETPGSSPNDAATKGGPPAQEEPLPLIQGLKVLSDHIQAVQNYHSQAQQQLEHPFLLVPFWFGEGAGWGQWMWWKEDGQATGVERDWACSHLVFDLQFQVLGRIQIAAALQRGTLTVHLASEQHALPWLRAGLPALKTTLVGLGYRLEVLGVTPLEDADPVASLGPVVPNRQENGVLHVVA